MKTKLLLTVLLVSALAVFNLNAGNGHDDQDDDDQGDHHCQEGDIDGQETFDARIVLTATANAPEGAAGSAKLKSENEDGSEFAVLKVHIKGLVPGDYVVSAVRKSDGSVVVLGSITEADDAEEGDQGDEDRDEQGDEGDDDGDNGVRCENAKFILPAELSATDVAQIVVSDVDGNAMLVGDLVSLEAGSSIKLAAKVRIKAEGARGARGSATLQSVGQKGKWHHSVTVNASGLPANASFGVYLNGTRVVTAKANKKGQLTVGKVSQGKSKVQTMRLQNAKGATAARARF